MLERIDKNRFQWPQIWDAVVLGSLRVCGDAVVASQVVLANGTVVTASDSENQDLFFVSNLDHRVQFTITVPYFISGYSRCRPFLWNHHLDHYQDTTRTLF